MVALLVEVQGTANRGPLCEASRNPGGQKNLKYWFWAKWTPPTKISYTSPHYYRKYEIFPNTNLCEQFK